MRNHEPSPRSVASAPAPLTTDPQHTAASRVETLFASAQPTWVLVVSVRPVLHVGQAIDRRHDHAEHDKSQDQTDTGPTIEHPGTHLDDGAGDEEPPRRGMRENNTDGARPGGQPLTTLTGLRRGTAAPEDAADRLRGASANVPEPSDCATGNPNGPIACVVDDNAVRDGRR